VIVVTGGTGTVGSSLVELLVECGEQVRIFCRDAEKVHRQFGGRAETATGDFGSRDSLRAAFAGAEKVFLLTAGAAEPGKQLEHERSVITAARDARVVHVVKLSVLGADEESPIHYLRWHREAEKELEASGLTYTILRPAGFMQNLLEWAADGSIYTCTADGRSPLVDTRDIAAVAAVVLTENGHQGKTYDLTGLEMLSYDEIAEKLSYASGREIRHVQVTPAILVQTMMNAGLPHWLAEDIALQFEGYATGHVPQTSSDITAVTGLKPHSFDAFAREEFATAQLKQPSH